MISSVVDGNESRGLDDGAFEGLHGLLMFGVPREGSVLASKVD